MLSATQSGPISKYNRDYPRLRIKTDLTNKTDNGELTDMVKALETDLQ